MDKLCEIKEGLKKHKVLYYMIPWLIVIFSFLQYLPIYGITFLDEKILGAIGDRAYAVLNPFTVTPYILLVLTIVVFLLYDKLWEKGMVLAAYAMSIIVSLISIMGMTKARDYIVFLPHVLGLLFLGYLEYKSWKQRKRKQRCRTVTN